MEFFKTETMKKEFDEFTKKILPGVLSCNLCRKLTCKYHSKFDPCCSMCRNEHCSNCKKFIISKDILLKYNDEEAKNYISNYICDFLNISTVSLNSFFPEIKVKQLNIEEKKKELYKKRVKSEKNSSKVVQQKLPTYVKSGNFQNGNRKIQFFY